MTIRRATYEESKSMRDFDVFIGDRRIDNSRGELLVAIENEKIKGYISYSSDMFFNKPFIRLLCVRQSAHRQGIGLALLKTVLNTYTGLDVWTSTEDWNEPAIKLFEKLGFEKKGTIAGLNKDNSNEVFFVLPAAAIGAP